MKTTTSSITAILAFSVLISACILPEQTSETTQTTSNNTQTIQFVSAHPDPETDNFTYTLPTGASPLRLSLPAEVEDITGIGGFGLHAGGHIEGLDHVWIELKFGTLVKSWADGEVKKIDFVGSPESGEYHITIDYGENLTGVHMEVGESFVKVGDKVKKGQVIAQGISYDGVHSSAELSLIDAGRRDGVDCNRGASYASPFDYLEETEKKKLVEAYGKKVQQVKEGGEWWGVELYQPFLTNKLFLHDENKGKLVGEWYLASSDWQLGYPNDILTFIEADNPYYKGTAVLGMDDESMGGNSEWSIKGVFKADYEKNTVKIIQDYGKTYYGIFEIDESGERAKLKIEYQEEDYPNSFSSNAHSYVERGRKSRRIDAVELGVLERP